jgi:hypothetical protein
MKRRHLLSAVNNLVKAPDLSEDREEELAAKRMKRQMLSRGCTSMSRMSSRKGQRNVRGLEEYGLAAQQFDKFTIRRIKISLTGERNS